MRKILTAVISVSIFIIGILLILCADTNFLWYAFNQNVRLTVVAGILIALVGGVGVIMNLWYILKELYSEYFIGGWTSSLPWSQPSER